MWESWGLHPPVPEEIKTHALATRLGLFWVKVLSTLPFEALPSYRSKPQLHNGCGEHERARTFEGLWPSWEEAKEVSMPFPSPKEFLGIVSSVKCITGLFGAHMGSSFSSAAPWNEECGSGEFNPVPVSPLPGHCHWSF